MSSSDLWSVQAGDPETAPGDPGPLAMVVASRLATVEKVHALIGTDA